ncbi:hypothetical protein DIPPA_54906 [Diplonema papillatum]|nr:hypothetical protein DIPPA_54906 [Diplonema papillatum]
MGKRKSLLDPTARKRARTEQSADAPLDADLWSADAARCERPKNKQHSQAKVASFEKTASVRKLQRVPESAQSYNPDLKEHQRAVDTAAAQLLKREAVNEIISAKARVNIAVRTTVVGDDLTAPGWEEHVQGEPRPEDAKAKRKTQQQRNKARRLVQEAKTRRTEKTRRKVVADIGRLDEIRKEMELASKQSAEKQQKKKTLRLKKALNPRIGRRRYKPSALDLQTDDEIKPSLRSQGKVSAAMRDPLKLRFESFQAQNLVPASAPLVRRAPRRPAKYFVVAKSN